MSLGDALDRAARTPSPDQAAAKWQLTLTSEHAEVTTGPVEAPIESATDWAGVLRHFGLEPGLFEVVDDTVRMSRWQQSKRLESGDRDTIWLHAYSARFRRVGGRVDPGDLEALRRRVASWRPVRPVALPPITATASPATLFVGWADWQIGKQGTTATVERITASFQRTVDRVKELRRAGRNISSIAVWNMGDPTESTSGNYPTQIYTLELNRRQQLGMALDLWLAGLRAFAPLAPDVEFGSLLCNHGENRQRGAQVTEEADNDSAYLAETLRTVLAEREGFGHVRWSIPADQMCMTTRMSGVEVALTHGHRMPTTAAKEVDRLRGQSIRLLREHGAEPRLWLTAHLHHLAVTDYGPFTRIQCPTSDSGSGWFSDRTGLWSTPGVLTCLVGEHPEARGMGWSDLAIL